MEHLFCVIGISSFRHARVHSATGDAVREHLAKDTIEGAALDAAKRIQERADALKAARPDCLGCADAVCDDCGPRPAHQDLPHRANDNKPGGRDLVGHSGVQAWSAGPIFPAVIARVEAYLDYGPCGNSGYPLAARKMVLGTRWELTYPGRMPQRFRSYEAAEAQARHLNAQRAAA